MLHKNFGIILTLLNQMDKVLPTNSVTTNCVAHSQASMTSFSMAELT